MLKKFLFTLICLSSPCYGEIVYTLSSAPVAPIDGLQFSPSGGEIIFTNHLVDPTGYLDFQLDYDSTDEDGNVFYTPHVGKRNLFILSNVLLQPLYVIENDFIVGKPKAINLGAGRYEFISDLLGESIPNSSAIFNRPGKLDFVFNTNLPLGHQVEGGNLVIADFGSVPEPPSLLLVSIAAAIVTGVFVSFKR